MRFFYYVSILCALVAPSFSHYSDVERNQQLSAIVATDLAKMPADEVRWILNQGIKAGDFSNKIAKVKVSKISKHLKKLSKYVIKPALFGAKPEHRSKNIYSIPYDVTRTLRDIPDFYISASDVQTPQQAYIVGEEPTKKTFSTFWQALLYAQVRTIVALSMPQKDPYYNDAYYPVSVNGWVISKISEQTVAKSPFILSQKMVQRVFWATKEDQKREITHIHIENWPDHGVIEGTLFLKLLNYIEQINPDGSSPIFVHCAAGIGRSGTFLAAHSIYKELSASKSTKNVVINLPMRILQMRMQRKNMLSREEQMTAVINAVREKAH